MKVYKFFDCLINILITALYLMFVFIVSCMFEVFPWFDGDGVYMLYMLVVWMPLCVLTLVQILLSLIIKRFDKPLVMLASLNAVYIPMIFLLGFSYFFFLNILLWYIFSYCYYMYICGFGVICF